MPGRHCWLISNVIQKSAKSIERTQRIVPLCGEQTEGVIEVRGAFLRHLATVGVGICQSKRRSRRKGRECQTSRRCLTVVHGSPLISSCRREFRQRPRPEA